MRRSYRLIRRFRTQAIRVAHLSLFLLGLLHGDQTRWTMSSVQVLGPYRQEKDHTGIPSWSIPLMWQEVEILIYTGTERGAAITEAILRGRSDQP